MKKKIIIIEDNLISSTALELMVNSGGYESVGKFDSADQLLELCETKEPHLILLDIMLNGKKNGLEAAREIREVSNIPIVFLTALSDSDSIKSIKEITNSDVAFKPYAEEIIFKKMNTMLNNNYPE